MRTLLISRTWTRSPTPPGASYVHICENNTIFGTRYTKLPQVPGVPLVADMSSCILSRPTDVAKYGLLYFGVQKNVAPAGMAVAVVPEDLVGKAAETVPSMLNYQTILEADSMYNTPPCWCIYMMGLTLKYIEQEIGGLAEMERRNNAKAALLYDYLDRQTFFKNPVKKAFRSIMNVTFTSPDADTDKSSAPRRRPRALVNPEGPSAGGRHAGFHLQRHARRGAWQSWCSSWRTSPRRTAEALQKGTCDMFAIKTLNNISPPRAWPKLGPSQFRIDEEGAAAQGILVRSAQMHEMELPIPCWPLAGRGGREQHPGGKNAARRHRGVQHARRKRGRRGRG